MKRYLRNKNRKSHNFFKGLYNAFITVALTFVMLWGLKAYSTSASLKFIQLSDIHFVEDGTNTTYKMTGESPALLDDAINQINEHKDVDFVMVTGDLIDKPFEKELKAVLPYFERLNSPWYFAFGNHDRCVGGYLDTNLFIKMIKASNKNYKFDMPYYSFVPKKGYRVIVLDSIITDEVTTQGIIDDEQYKWLKKELDRAKNDTVLIFMHVPLIEPFPSPSHRLRNSTAIMSLLESYNNPIGVFQGHYHAAKITQRNNVLYVNTPALVSYPNAFRSVNVTNYRGKVVFEFGWHETRETTIQKMAKILVLVSTIYTGEEKDQSGTYEIMK